MSRRSPQSLKAKFENPLRTLNLGLCFPFASVPAMNFLVTGGAGFIGSHLCERLLREGHAVWALDDLNDFYAPSIKARNLQEIQSLDRPFTFVRGDLTERAAIDQAVGGVKFDQIIHLAAPSWACGRVSRSQRSTSVSMLRERSTCSKQPAGTA